MRRRLVRTPQPILSSSDNAVRIRYPSRIRMDPWLAAGFISQPGSLDKPSVFTSVGLTSYVSHKLGVCLNFQIASVCTAPPFRNSHLPGILTQATSRNGYHIHGTGVGLTAFHVSGFSDSERLVHVECETSVRRPSHAVEQTGILDFTRGLVRSSPV